MHIAIPFILGLLAASVVSKDLWFLTAFIGMLPFAAGLRHRSIRKQTLLCTLSFLMACCVYWHHDARTVKAQLSLAGSDILFTGTIEEKNVYASGSAGYILKGSFGDTDGRLLYVSDMHFYSCGDTLVLSGTAEALENSYAFNTAAYYRAKNVFLQMDPNAGCKYISCEHPGFPYSLYRWRDSMVQRFTRHMSDEGGAMLAGMLFGDRSGMDTQSKHALTRAGIGHILAVSGLHLDFLAMCLILLLQKCRAGRWERFAVSAAVCILFSVCVGGTVSVKRACIMVLLSQGAGLFFRQSDSLTSLSVAMLILCLDNPFVIHSSAFWLSCSGAFGIGVLAPFMTKDLTTDAPQQKLCKQAAELLCVFTAVFPASALYFQSVTLLSPITNLLLAPLCMAAIAFGAAAVCLPECLAEYILYPADLLCNFVLRISKQLALLPVSHILTNSRQLHFLLLLSLGFVTLGFLLYKSRRFLVISCILSMLTIWGASAAEQAVSQKYAMVYTLGGKEDAALVIQWGKEAVIVDVTGSSRSASSVKTCLESNGIEEISSLVFCNTNDNVLKSYTRKLPLYTPESAYALNCPEKLSAPQIMGVWAEKAESHSFVFHDAAVTAKPGCVEIYVYGIRIVCCTEEALPPENADILEICGQQEGILPECGMLIILSEDSFYLPDAQTLVGENNLELCIAPDGKYRIRRLYADT